MSASFPKVKGFKMDKRNLIESTNNLVVFGQGQMPPETGVNKGRRLLRRGGLRHRRSKPKSLLPPGACSTTQKLDRLVHRVELSNYFANTKPWNDPAQKKSSFIRQPQHLQNFPAESEIAVGLVPTTGDFGDVDNIGLLSVEGEVPLPKQQRTFIFLDKSPSLNFVKDVVCPVCLKGFEPLAYSKVPVSDVMKHSLAAYQQQNGMVFKKNLEDGWGALAKPKCVLEPQDVVVAANCGELFHRLCLRDWCARGHRKSPRSTKPIASCPSCGKDLKYTMCQEVETLRCYSRDATMLQREFLKIKHVNKELQELWPETNSYLRKIKKEIEDTETLYNELRSKRRGVKSELRKLTADDFGIVMAKVSDVATMNASLQKQDKALEFMQQETLHIVRMYLLTVIRKIKACGIAIPIPGELVIDQTLHSLIGPIPPQLVPYLQDIVNDNHALSLFSQIIAPLPDTDAPSDGSRQKCLEMELVNMYTPKSATNLTRPNTYVVCSSAAEVGDSDTDDVIAKKIKSSSSVEQETVMAATSLKASTATHEISTIPSNNIPENLLRVPNTSNLSVIYTDKPLQLLEVLKLDESTSTIDSGLLEGKFLEVACSPGRGSCTDKKRFIDHTSSCHSSPSSARSCYEGADSPFSTISVENPFTTTFSTVPTNTLHYYEQDSKYVQAIRQLMMQSVAEPKKPGGTPATVKNSVSNTGANMIKIHNKDVASGENEHMLSTNSEENQNQLNEMLISFMRRQQDLRLDPKNQQINKGSDDDEHKMSTVVLLAASAKKSSSQSTDCGNGDNQMEDNFCDANENLNINIDDTWIQISPETLADGEDQPVHSRESYHYPQFSQNSGKSKQLREPILTGLKMNNSSALGRNSCESPSVVDNCTTTLYKEHDDEVSIAIMYIIENDGRDNTESEPEDEKKIDEKEHRERMLQTENNYSNNLLLPPLPTKVLSPVYITAEKTSNYSIIANRNNSSAGKDSSSSNELFVSITWPRRNVLEEVISSTFDMEMKRTDQINNDVPKDSEFQDHDPKELRTKNDLMEYKLESIVLPPAPEEQARTEVKATATHNIIPILTYENETDMR